MHVPVHMMTTGYWKKRTMRKLATVMITLCPIQSSLLEMDEWIIAQFHSRRRRNSHWFEPRPDELTLPPNSINHNSVLDAWKRASRYDPYSAIRVEEVILEWLELGTTRTKEGDAVELNDALSYLIVIRPLVVWMPWKYWTWIESPPSSYRPRKDFTDEEWIHKATISNWNRWSSSNGDYLEEDDDDYSDDGLVNTNQSFSRTSSYISTAQQNERLLQLNPNLTPCWPVTTSKTKSTQQKEHSTRD